MLTETYRDFYLPATILLRKYWYFLLIVPPVVIPLAISSVGDLAISDGMRVCLLCGTEPVDAFSVKYLHFFYAWVNTLALMTLVGIAGAVYSFRVFNNESLPAGKLIKKAAWWVAGILPFYLLYLRYKSPNYIRMDSMNILFSETIADIFVQCGSLMSLVAAILTVTDFLWVPSAAFIIMGVIACVTSAADGVDTKKFAQERNVMARNLLYFASAMLATGIVAINFVLSIPASLYETPPDEVTQLASAIKFQLGYSYTLIILSVYIPVSLILHKINSSYGKDVVADDESNSDDDLGLSGDKPAKTWLSLNLFAKEIMAALSPLVIGAVLSGFNL